MIRSCGWNEKRIFIALGLAVTDFLPFSSLWKLPTPLWIVTGKSQITHYSYRYVKTPYALNEAVQMHPYCTCPNQLSLNTPIACTWSRPNMTPYTWKIECSWWGTFLRVPPLGGKYDYRCAKEFDKTLIGCAKNKINLIPKIQLLYAWMSTVQS